MISLNSSPLLKRIVLSPRENPNSPSVPLMAPPPSVTSENGSDLQSGPRGSGTAPTHFVFPSMTSPGGSPKPNRTPLATLEDDDTGPLSPKSKSWKPAWLTSMKYPLPRNSQKRGSENIGRWSVGDHELGGGLNNCAEGISSVNAGQQSYKPRVSFTGMTDGLSSHKFTENDNLNYLLDLAIQTKQEKKATDDAHALHLGLMSTRDIRTFLSPLNSARKSHNYGDVARAATSPFSTRTFDGNNKVSMFESPPDSPKKAGTPKHAAQGFNLNSFASNLNSWDTKPKPRKLSLTNDGSATDSHSTPIRLPHAFPEKRSPTTTTTEDDDNNAETAQPQKGSLRKIFNMTHRTRTPKFSGSKTPKFSGSPMSSVEPILIRARSKSNTPSGRVAGHVGFSDVLPAANTCG